MTPTVPNSEPKKADPARTEARRHGRPQSPKAALGASAQSGLLMASIQAGVLFSVLFAGLTFGPYFWENSQAATKAPATPEKTDPPVAQTPVAPPPSTPDPKLPAGGTPVVTKQPGKGDIVDKLGENGSKPAPTKVNPLDKKDDDLLKDIK